MIEISLPGIHNKVSPCHSIPSGTFNTSLEPWLRTGSTPDRDTSVLIVDCDYVHVHILMFD